MKLYCLSEGLPYDLQTLRRLLGDIPSDNIFDFAKAACGRGFCRLVSGARYSFNYVGMLEYTYEEDRSLKSVLIFVEPKFFPRVYEQVRQVEKLSEAQNVVMRAMMRYHKGKDTSFFSSAFLENGELKNHRLAICLALVLDVMDKGPYMVFRAGRVRNGSGEIDWPATIESEQPIFVEERPVYMNYLTQSTETDEDNYITRLQACIVSSCYEELVDLGIAQPLGLDNESPYEGDLTDFGNKDYIVSRIGSELQCQFVTCKQFTLKLMLAYIDMQFDIHGEGVSLQSLGMTGFHELWERAIKDVFCDELDRIPSCARIPLVCDKEEKQNSTFLDYIDAPQWTPCRQNDDNDEIEDDVDADKLEPDFVSTCSHNDNKWLIILDAKYYRPSFNGGKIRNQPGVGDVDKQMLYQLAYKGLVNKNNLKVKNAFIFPGWFNTQLSGVKGDTVIHGVRFADVIITFFAETFKDQGLQENLETYKIDGVVLLDWYVRGVKDEKLSSLSDLLWPETNAEG